MPNATAVPAKKKTRSATASPAVAPKKAAAPTPVAKKKVAAKPAPKTVTKPTKPPAKTAPVVAATQPAASSNGKQKLVRDSFTMPSNDFGLIHTLKERAITFRRPAKKSELLRAGLHALAALNDAKLKSVLDGLAPLKSGRPKKAD